MAASAPSAAPQAQVPDDLDGELAGGAGRAEHQDGLAGTSWTRQVIAVFSDPITSPPTVAHDLRKHSSAQRSAFDC
jgi:hypothetical protein